MKKPFLMVLILLLSVTQTGIAVASNTLKISYEVEADIGYFEDNPSLFSDTNLIGSPEALLSAKKMSILAKAATTKSRLTAICKSMDPFGARIKVTDARGGTAGLSNLNSVFVANIQVSKEISSLPDYSEEEDEALQDEYDAYEDYPDYSEDGYLYYFISAKCLFKGSVSLTSSNAYRIYIDGKQGPEYSKAELSKKKWSLTLVDV